MKNLLAEKLSSVQSKPYLPSLSAHQFPADEALKNASIPRRTVGNFGTLGVPVF